MSGATFSQLAGRLRRPLLVLAIGCLGVVVMWLLENMLVYPAPGPGEGLWTPDFAHEEVRFASADGTSLHGWLLPAARPTDVWIVYFHGNGEHVAYVGPYLAELRSHLAANIFVFDYRGYGRSEGAPHEAGVLADGDAALQWVVQRSGKDARSVVLYGRSLGGAVAADLAARHGARGLILESTFTRLTDAASAALPWVPMRWLMRNRYDSVDKIPKYCGPLLCSHGDRDGIVPIKLGRKLFEAAGTPAADKRFCPLPGLGHNDPGTREYYQQLRQFLEQLPPRGPACRK